MKPYKNVIIGALIFMSFPVFIFLFGEMEYRLGKEWMEAGARREAFTAFYSVGGFILFLVGSYLVSSIIVNGFEKEETK